MIRRSSGLLVLCALALGACREERVTLAPQTEELLRAKADARIASLLTRPESPPFAAIVVFRSDVFLHQSAMLDRHNISLLDSFDNVAILLLDNQVTPSLLAEESVRKVRYLCPPPLLARLHPTFLMSTLRRFGNSTEDEPVPFFLRFREAPTDKDVKAVQDAGYLVRAREGSTLSVSGPLAGLPRLLEMNEIVSYEGASKLRTM